jgi:hypothetical protein
MLILARIVWFGLASLVVEAILLPGKGSKKAPAHKNYTATP